MTASGSPVTAVISGIGAWVPDRVLKNNDIAKLVDTSDEWISTRTGICERHIGAENEPSSVIASNAARSALNNAGVKAEEIDIIIVATITPDSPLPATACYVQAQIGAVNATCFDIAAACSGFVYALDIARQYIAAGSASRILVIGVDKMSTIVNWEDRGTCVLFGDGAGAVIVERGTGHSKGIIAASTGSDGTQASMLYTPAGGSAMPASIETVKNKQHYMVMDGNNVFKSAVRGMSDVMQAVLVKSGLSMDNIDFVVPHQANIRIINAIADKLCIPSEKIVINLDRYGNTTAASIPLALNEAVQDRRIKDGSIVLLVAFGAGFTWGASVIQWGK